LFAIEVQVGSIALILLVWSCMDPK